VQQDNSNQHPVHRDNKGDTSRGCQAGKEPGLNINQSMARLKPGCICTGVKLVRILEAIDAGATSFAEIAHMTGIGAGSCGGKRCGRKVAELLAQRNRTKKR